MAVSQESAYTSDMSWKDYLTPEEEEELEAATSEKAQAVEKYNALWKTLKTRCDARVRREKARSAPPDQTN